MDRLNILLILLLLFLSSGCATIIHGTTQDVGIITDPSGAELVLDGQERYKSPAKITMKRKEDHTVEVSKAGYQKETINIKSVLSGAVAANIIAGGLIGWGVDAVSGGQYRLVPETVDLRLRPVAMPVTNQTSQIKKQPKETLEEKLDQAKKLKDKGKITEEEYSKMRQDILSAASKTQITITATIPNKAKTAPYESPKAVLPKPEEKKDVGAN